MIRRCVLCNRRVSDEARVVPGLGAFGSQCVRAVAAFEALLESHHAAELSSGLFVPVDAPQQRAREVNALIAKLQNAGIKVIGTHVEGGLEFRLGGVGSRARARPFLRSLGNSLGADGTRLLEAAA